MASKLHYAGIDEAGYGPMLGPLCVASTAFHVTNWQPGHDAPDLWDRLKSVVSRSGRHAASRIPIDDSKKLKLPNSTATRHPLTHLERGVLTMLPATSRLQASTTDSAQDDSVRFPTDQLALFNALGAELDDAPWYEPAAISLPVSTSAPSIAIDRNALQRAMHDADIHTHSMRCIAFCERQFNDLCARRGSKAAVTAQAVSQLIAQHLTVQAEAIRIVCDRQSGRSNYQDIMTNACQGRSFEVIAEGQTASAYRVNHPSADIVVHFRVEADQGHLPVALASMTAKYIRELAMARFNHYWCARLPGLKPTAGYTTDARRWLADMGSALSIEERKRLIRLA
jgi:ribonuclease HII